MKKMTGMIAALLVLPFCVNTGALAMPSNGHPAAGKAVDMAPGKSGGEDLVVTLEYPRNSPWLAEMSRLQQGRKPLVTLKVPVADDKYANLPMATVDGDPLTVGAFRQALLPDTSDDGESVTVAGQNPQALLERLINSRVFVAEAREIGLDQIPELVEFVEVFKRRTLRELMMNQCIDSAKEDEEVVQRLYREAIKEAKIKAVLFDKKEYADDFVASLKEGVDFDEAAAQAVADEKAELKGGKEGYFAPRSEMSSKIATAIDNLEKGGVSSVIPAAKDQFAVVQLLDTRFPDNPHAKAEARTKARNFAQNTALVDCNRNLTEKYVKLDRDLFESLNFAENIEDLLKDERVLAEIKGSEPVTVAEVADALKSRYYHGYDRAVDEGKVERDKITTLNDTIAKRVFLQEALAQGLDQTKEYQSRVREYEDSMIFGAYMKKVLVPKLTLSMDDLRSYYGEHKNEYTTPRMVGIHSLAFSDEEDARDALTKLQQGTEVNWLESNAPGQVTGADEKLLDFGEGLITTTSMPEGVRKVLENVSAGDTRLYSDDNGHYYVLYVQRVVPSRVQPFDQVQQEILKAVYSEKLQKIMQKWGGKLREVYPVEVFVKEFSNSKL